jgi:hypothetical protein
MSGNKTSTFLYVFYVMLKGFANIWKELISFSFASPPSVKCVVPLHTNPLKHEIHLNNVYKLIT